MKISVQVGKKDLITVFPLLSPWEKRAAIRAQPLLATQKPTQEVGRLSKHQASLGPFPTEILVASCPGFGNNILEWCEEWEDPGLLLILQTRSQEQNRVMQSLLLLLHIALQKSPPVLLLGSIQLPAHHHPSHDHSPSSPKASHGLCRPIHQSPVFTNAYARTK